MLDMHFDGVFRKIEFAGDQLVRKTKLQLGKDLLFPWSKVDIEFLGLAISGTTDLIVLSWNKWTDVRVKCRFKA